MAVSQESDQTQWPLFRPAGDSGLIVEFGNHLSEEISNAVLAFDSRLRSEAIAGVSETASTIRSVLVRYDPLEMPPDRLRGRLSELLAEQDWLSVGPPEGRSLWRIPALYGGEAGPDMEETARLLEASEHDLAEEHGAARQRVLMLGFAPGFAYLGGLPARWNIPRLPHVKPAVPPGSISVAVGQTSLCATVIPTGWRTIARTPFLNFDLKRDPVFPMEAGDEVQFEPIEEADYRRLAAQAEGGAVVASREALT